MELDSTSFLKCELKTYQPEQSLCKIKCDTKHHRTNHTSSFLKPDDMNVDTSHKLLLDAFCNENVIKQIISNLTNKNE